MKQIKQVVSTRNLSRKPPINITIQFALFVKAFGVLDNTWSSFIAGGVGAVILGIWGMYIIDVIKYNEQPRDIFSDEFKKQLKEK